jgi:hypothetical protein
MNIDMYVCVHMHIVIVLLQLLDYISQVLDEGSPLLSGFPRAVFLLATCALLTLLNLRGLQVLLLLHEV